MLIAEDERRLAELIARGLRREGMAVDVAPDGAEALVKAGSSATTSLVLDRDLPIVHGDEVCRAVRGERPETGILMLTAAAARSRTSSRAWRWAPTTTSPSRSGSRSSSPGSGPWPVARLPSRPPILRHARPRARSRRGGG